MSSIVTGSADADQQLSEELDRFNSNVMPGPAAVELTARCLDQHGELLGGVSGWTWQEAAGIGLT